MQISLNLLNYCHGLLLVQIQNRDDGKPTYNVTDVWKRNVTGQGVVVAVVDEGFDPDHPEIKDNYVSHIYILFIQAARKSY